MSDVGPFQNNMAEASRFVFGIERKRQRLYAPLHNYHLLLPSIPLYKHTFRLLPTLLSFFY